MDQAGEESEIERHAAGWSRLFLGFPGLLQCDGSLCGCWDWIRRLLQVKSGKIRDSWGLDYSSYLSCDGVGDSAGK